MACGLHHRHHTGGDDGVQQLAVAAEFRSDALRKALRLRGPRLRRLRGVIIATLAGKQQTRADTDDHQAADRQNGQLQPCVILHQPADAEKAGQRQRHVEKQHDQRGQQRTAARLGQRRIDDEQILHTDRRHIRQSQRQPLEKESHTRLLSIQTYLVGCNQPSQNQPNRSFCNRRKNLYSAKNNVTSVILYRCCYNRQPAKS